MSLEEKIQNPVCINLVKNSNVILIDNEKYPLEPGVMFGGERFGFIVISENNGKQKETVYPTQCRIEAIGMERDVLKVFEEGKKVGWRFDKNCKLEHSTFDEYTDEYRQKIDTIIDNYNMFAGEEVRLENPIQIKIAKDPEMSVILPDNLVKQEYPLCPGVLLGNVHYGFILIIDTDKGQKEIVYPTQNRIEAVGVEGDCYNDLRVFEQGKYHPWLFYCDGKFKQQASFNPCSKRDKQFIEDRYGLSNVGSNDVFTLQKKQL